MNAVFDPDTLDSVRLTTDQIRAFADENAKQLGADTANVFGFGNDTLARVSGMHGGMAGHAENGTQITQEELERRKRDQSNLRAFADSLNPIITQQLLELTEEVDEQISFVQQEIVVNGQQIAVTTELVEGTSEELDAANEAVRMDTTRLLHEADALSMRSYEAGLAEEAVTAEVADAEAGYFNAHIQQYYEIQAAEADARVEEQRARTEVAREAHGESLEQQAAIEAQLETLEARLEELHVEREELGERLEGYETFRERINSPEVRAQLESGDITIAELQTEFEALENGGTVTPAIAVVDAEAEVEPVAEVEEVELTQADVQTKLVTGELETGQLAAEGVSQALAAELEGRDLAANSTITDRADGVQPVAQQIDTAANGGREGQAAAEGGIQVAGFESEKLNSMFMAKAAPGVPEQQFAEVQVSPQTPSLGVSSPALTPV